MENVLTTNQKKRRKGFTLIELIIVLAVMAIIAAIAIPNLAGVSNNAKKKADIQSCETVKRTALTLVATGDMKPGKYTLDPDGATKLSWDGEETLVTEVVNSFKDVNNPKYNEKTNYYIEVVGDDVTQVYTGTAEGDDTGVRAE